MFGVLNVDGSEVEVSLVPDPTSESPALAHGAGMALSHRGKLPDGPQRDAVLLLGKVLRALPAGLDSEGVRSRLSRAVADQGTLHWNVAVAEPDTPEPDTPEPTPPPVAPQISMRRERGTTHNLWGFDSELALLRVGQRSLIKREHVPLKDASAVAEEFTRGGYHTAWLQTDETSGIVFVSRDPSVCVEAVEWKTRWTKSEHDRAGRILAQAWLGTALGYPACCVQRFTELDGHDDGSLARALLPRGEYEPASPYSQWTSQVSLLSHSPCSLDCAASIAVGATAAAEIGPPGSPGLAVWRDLAQRVHMLLPGGEAIAIKTNDAPLRSALVVEASQVREIDGQAALHHFHELVGQELRVEDEQLVVGPYVASVFADHRGSFD